MTQSEKKVSIIIPCYNSAEYLARSWESLKKQTIGIEALECIFVNDCSTDNGKTWEKLKAIEEDAPDSVMIVDLSENVGPGEARNVGIGYASAEFLLFFDSDDELDKEACEKLYNLAKRHNTDIIQFNHLYILDGITKSSNNSKENKLYSIGGHEDRIKFLNATVVTYGCTNKLYRTDLIKQVGVRFPSKMRYEEPLFVYPLFLYATNIYILNENLYLYYINKGSMITSQLGKRLLDHPRVQLMLLEFCIDKGQVFNEYRNVIMIYFLWSFYCETISFAGNYPDAFLPLDYFESMQRVCKSVFFDWKSNPLLSMIPIGGQEVIRSVDRHFCSQQELDEYIKDACKLV